MLIKSLQKTGMTSDIAFGAAAASIALSIAIWMSEKGEDAPHAERFGIFVGLWAPTFAVLGNALKMEEEKTL